MIRSASSTTSIAWHHESWRTLCTVEPPPGKSPRRGSESWNHAVSAHTRRSVFHIISRPPAAQTPLMAAITGL